MSVEVRAPNWKGSLARLRAVGCPSLEPVLRVQMPQNAILVLDHNAINDVVASTMEALTGADYDNKLIVPELALDFFDVNAKSSSKAAFNPRRTDDVPSSSFSGASRSVLRPQELLNYDKLQLKKDVLLKQATFRIIVQRVNEYDSELLTKLEISPKSFDTRLYVLCALYFKKKHKQPTAIITSDPVVIEMAAEYDIVTCPAEKICCCGELLMGNGKGAANAKMRLPAPVGQAKVIHRDAAATAKAKPGATVRMQQSNPNKGKKR